MIKSKYLILLLIVFLFSILSSFSVNAQTYLNENSTWYQNITNITQGSIAFGDYDSDGDLDLVLTGTPRIARVYENNGTTLRENLTWQQNLTGVNYGSHMFGDIDNDGDLDLALTGCNAGAGAVSACNNGKDLTKIYENNGTSFSENTTWSQNLTAMYRSSLSLGDIDNDGDLDLVITGTSTVSGWSRNAKVYLNNGTSLVDTKQWYENLTGLSDSFLVLGDIDIDNNLDLILSGRDSNNNKFTKVYLNNGTAFEESSQWSTNLHKVNQGSLVLGDFDNDGDLDLSLTGCCDHHKTYLNNGTSFVESQKESTEGGSLGGILEGSQALGDYDNDGDLDLVLSGRERRTYFHLGYKNGSFSSPDVQESHIQNVDWSSVAWSDLDNDSDLDLMITGYDSLAFGGASSQFKIYTNNISTPNNKPSHPNQFTNYTTTKGNIHLGWGNGSDNETPSNGLYYNLRLGSSSAGNQIISGKYGGGEDNGYFGNMMQRKNFTLKTTRLSSNTQYFWSVQTIDTGLKTSNWSAEQTFTTQADLTPPTITATKPNNYFNISQANITFNITAYDNVNISNITIYGNWTPSGWHINQTNSSALNNSNHLFTNNLTAYGDGFYLWNTRACDNSSLCTFAQNRTFLIDTTYPLITLISPSNDSTIASPTIPFQYNVSDQRISNCTLIIDSSIDQTNHSTRINTTETFYKTLANKNYNWSINCTDQLNHRNFSKTYQLTVNYQPVQPTTGGISSRAGKRAQLTPTKQLVPKEPKQPVKRIEIKEEHLEEIKFPKKEIPKSKLVTFFETILAFIISLFIILSYVWIIKEDFKK